MVTVETTKELSAGDFLLRFEAKALKDDVHGISSISARLMFGIVATHSRFFSLACRVFLLLFIFIVSRVLLCLIFCTRSTAHVCW